MSWLLNLYETYQSNLDRVGVLETRHNGQEYTLLPVSHTTQNAHIEVLVTEGGDFHSARVIEKQDASTLIPCTEDSASRAGAKIAPYPLHDKLSYVAGDYVAYGGTIKKEEPFSYYIKQLGEWAESRHATDKVRSIFAYLRKGTLIRDLSGDPHRILLIDRDGKLVEQWDKQLEEQYGDKPKLFSVVAGETSSAFVRFTVHSPDRILAPVWQDPDMYKSFLHHYSSQLGGEDYCYVTGKMLPATDKHANKIRNAADKAKLISANDSSGFTYRGRFKESDDAASISYEVSQKAHNALKWLINQQGKFFDQRVFLVWGNQQLDQLDMTDDFYSLSSQIAAPQRITSYTNQEYAGEVAKLMDGYRGNVRDLKAHVNILVLDSATTGRMAVLYYRNLHQELYLNRLEYWHSTCTWLHRYRRSDEGEWVLFEGAPATRDIAFAAYGPTASDKVIKGLVERMLPCIIDQREIPLDIVSSAFRRASNPVSMERWEWEKTLSIACALINKQSKGRFRVGLDESVNDRDYLFGRLLAVADVLERNALEEGRATNAIRYMNAFSRHPARTWTTIQASLQPYQAKMGVKAGRWNRIIDEVASRIPIEDFTDRPLSGKYLLGFYSQRHALYQKKQVQDGVEQIESQGEMEDDNA